MLDNTYSTIYDIVYSLTFVQDEEKIEYIIDKLKNSELLDTDERNAVESYIGLRRETQTNPNAKTLVSRNVAFSSALTIQEDALLDIVKIFLKNKQAMKTSSEIMNLVTEYTKPGANREEIAERIISVIDSQNNKEFKIDEPLTFSEEKREDLINKKELERGIPFGIDFIDSLYRGLTPGAISIIAGYAGSMKTTLAVNQCFIGMQLGYNTLYLSLEVSEEDLVMNLMSLYTISCTNEPIKREDIIKLKQKDPDKFRKIYDGLMNLPGKLEIYDENRIGSCSKDRFDEIVYFVDKRFKDVFGTGLHHVVLDHAQLLKFDSTGIKDPYMVVNDYASYFRRLAALRQICVTVVSQTSRQGYEYACKHGGQYTLTGLAESNELERAATIVVAIFNSDELKASGQLMLQILKNRYGPTMLEPQTTIVKPEYYLVGNGYNTNAQQVDAIFGNGEAPANPFDNQTEVDLESLLGGM